MPNGHSSGTLPRVESEQQFACTSIIPCRSEKLRVGDKYGKLLVCGIPFRMKLASNAFPAVVCECECGTVRAIRVSHLICGRVNSCGCLNGERHGDSETKLYRCYKSMQDRCLRKKCSAWKHYGGKGIKICQEWIDSFAAFREWALSHGYKDGLTIERKDNSRGYEPENCCWIPHADQGKNTTKNVNVAAFGEIKSVAEWARDERCVVQYGTLQYRRRKGWDFEKAMATPEIRAYERFQIPCECGCGTLIWNREKHGIKRFAHGHNRRVNRAS